MTANPGPPPAVRLDAFTPSHLAGILGDGPDPFGVSATGLTWLPKEEHFGIRLDGRLVAHAGLRRVPVALGGAETEVIGVGGVAVAPDLRGRGLARRAVEAALAHARTMGPRHALLFCRPPLVARYARLGWREVPGDVWVEQPTGSVRMPLHSLWTPLQEGAAWPPGTARLRSLPM
ncbi:GNAT family N-acetyltransferase [Streptomyces sp. RS10V-4]|uniref:GNAT family N-acetyltransferase n=1 Tax=Streptomyces rhizoryzae TaxID=2932493 RepID=UPI0020036743|nr:GNAT family N-acetyltransferase [Streptomyces rhizoryzae]MCK7621760.1 GNAT family N-acetyltransferase [Streptomyces rhizoryzae]